MDDIIEQFFFDDDALNLNIVGNIVDNLARPLPLLIIEPRPIQVRNEDYFEQIIPIYTDLQFFEHFRMSRESAEELARILGNFLPNPDQMAPLRKKLLFTIWILSKQESFLATGDRFNLPLSTGHEIFRQIITTIAGLLQQYIVWPNMNSYEEASVIFQNRSRGFPGIIGAIDGCHIPCKQPVANEVDYYNRKGFHSIILQGTCDQRGMFIDVYIGSPGRMHDARVFRNSPLYQRMMDPHFIPVNYHLLGDAAYPLKVNLMTPFRDTGHLTPGQTMYNIKLCSMRAIIERSFGLLKGRFRRLKYLDISDFELGNNIIAAACVLHNFITDRNYIEGIYENEEMIPEIPENPAIPREEEGAHFEMAAIEKRNNIVLLFQ